MTRHPARSQALPPDEASRLRALSPAPTDQHARARDLFQAGWTLQAIGAAFSPPRARSTVKAWIDRTPATAPRSEPPVTHPPTRPTAEPTPHRRVASGTPALTATEADRLFTLQTLARRYRAKHPPEHPSARANQELTILVQSLYASGVTIQQLASAAHVTHHAMSKRVKKDTSHARAV